MVNVGSQDNQINITVSSGGNTSNVNATPDMAAYYSDKSKEWATSNKIVDGVDYSSKYYANISNQSATTAQGYKEQAQEILDNTRAISDSAIDSINTSKTTALDELEAITTSSLAEATAANSLIVSNKTNAVNEISTTKSDALSAVSSSKINAISEINTTKNDALSAVNTNKTSAVTEINNYKITSVAEINSSKSGALENINTAKDEALEEIASAGGGDAANKDLSNLSEEGENKFVKTDDLVEVSIANTDLSNLSATGEKHFLGKSQITNCITEMPQRIKYTLESGTLTIKAGSVVIVPYGTEDKTAQYPKGATFLNDNFKIYDTQFEGGKFFVWAELVNDVSDKRSTTDTNTRFITFYVHTNKIDGAVSVASGTSITTSVLFYNTSTNFVEYLNNGTNTDGNLAAFPLGISKADGTNKFASISQVFNGFGYIGRHAWFDKGIKCLFGINRNPDGTIENKELTTNFYVWETHNWTEGRLVFITENGAKTDVMPSRVLQGLKSEMPSEVSGNSLHLYICTDTLEVFQTNTKVANWQPQSRVVPIFEYGAVNPSDGNTLTYFKPYQPFRAVDYNDAVLKSMPHITQTYKNGTSWYRVWSDGWIEQGGRVSVNSDTGVTVTFLKPFANTNYYANWISCSGVVTTGSGSRGADTLTTTSMRVYNGQDVTMTANWYACGY